MGKPIKLTIGKTKGIDLDITKKEQINLNFTNKAIGSYPPLTLKPSINGYTIIGDKTGDDYDLQNKMNEITEQEIDNVIFG